MPEPEFYKADDVKTIAILELTCERDEALWISKLTKLQLAESDGVNGTAATYKEVDSERVGRLFMIEFQNQIDRNAKKVQTEAKGHKFMFDGQAFIKDRKVNLMVFREKKAD